MIKVTPRAHRRGDHAGDPLDGLVNLFDVGVVLAVGFLLAALASLHLSGSLTHKGTVQPKNEVTVGPSDAVSTVPPGGQRTTGRGRQVGRVYRLQDGTLIYVVPSGTTTVTPPPTSAPPTP